MFNNGLAKSDTIQIHSNGTRDNTIELQPYARTFLSDVRQPEVKFLHSWANLSQFIRVKTVSSTNHFGSVKAC